VEPDDDLAVSLDVGGRIMASKKLVLLVQNAFNLPVVKDDQLRAIIISPCELGGVYLRLLEKSLESSHDIVQVNVVINGIEYEIEQNTRGAAHLLAKTIADLAII
jgi:hypothetical protein